MGPTALIVRSLTTRHECRQRQLELKVGEDIRLPDLNTSDQDSSFWER